MRLKRLRRNPIVPLLLLLVALLLGYAQAYGPKDDPERDLALISRVYNTLAERTAKPVDRRDLVYAAIDGMLETLDPHTHFLDQETFRYMHQEQEGEFFGIGVSFDVRDGYLTVVSPLEDTPAWRAGIHAGDRIVTIDGEDAIGITTSEVINRLRGRKGEPVVIGVDRPGQEGIKEFTLVRDRIPLESVRYAFMIRPGLAYVRITTFAQSTARELQLALEELAAQGMQRLILDLRGNSGGLLSTADEICSMFLPSGSEIVSTRGRVRGSDSRLKVHRNGAWSDLPLVVVVDRWSASASEIVAAAVQDQDRGLLVGDVTFGKGLVGSLYELAHGTALQVTTAQYFTPSGRFIQKPYDIPHRQPPEKTPVSSDAPTYTTRAGREIAGGGGITPDVRVEEPILSPLMVRLDLEEGLFFDMAVEYVDRHGKVDESWEPDPDEMEEFLDRIRELEPAPSEAEIEADAPAIRRAIRREVIGVSQGIDAAYRVRIEASAAIQKAVEVAPEINTILARSPTPVPEDA